MKASVATTPGRKLASFGKSPKTNERVKHLGAIKHREFKELKGGKSGVIYALSDYVDPEGKVIITEERSLTFHADGETRTIDVDIDLVASQGTVTVDDKKDSGLSIRVPHSMSVDAKEGGKIINSEGHQDADSWGKRAKWCDFHGPVEGEHLGIAMLNHPQQLPSPHPMACPHLRPIHRQSLRSLASLKVPGRKAAPLN
jgi:hypothetical protein